jgi:hypothetical protein
VTEPCSTGLARMSTMLAGKTTPDRATMLHNEFPISPTWHANCQGVRPGRSCDNLPRRILYYLLNQSTLVIKQ